MSTIIIRWLRSWESNPFFHPSIHRALSVQQVITNWLHLICKPPDKLSGKGSISHHAYGIQPQPPVYHSGVLNFLRYLALNYVVVFCWEGGIRTPELRREQIYSLSPLTTRPPLKILKRIIKAVSFCRYNLMVKAPLLCFIQCFRVCRNLTFLANLYCRLHLNIYSFTI